MKIDFILFSVFFMYFLFHIFLRLVFDLSHFLMSRLLLVLLVRVYCAALVAKLIHAFHVIFIHLDLVVGPLCTETHKLCYSSFGACTLSAQYLCICRLIPASFQNSEYFFDFDPRLLLFVFELGQRLQKCWSRVNVVVLPSARQ
jgi:hypothetical protein